MRLRLWLLFGAALLAATPAAAFDCAKAATSSEKAICADPKARAADAAMAQAFETLLAADPAQKPALVAAQSRWIASRDAACADDKKLGACLARESAERRAFLAAEPEAGPGAPGRLAPFVRYRKGGKGKAEIDVQALKYPAPATPAERAFNQAVDRLIGSLDEPGKDDPAADRYAYQRDMRLVFASPALISAHMSGYQDTGGAHPNSFSGDINIDVARGRELTFADLTDAKGAKAIFALCQKQVIAQKKEREGADAQLGPDDIKQLAKSIAEATGDLKVWSFALDKASVSYDPDAVGAHAEGAFDCEIPYSILKPLAKPDFPFPER